MNMWYKRGVTDDGDGLVVNANYTGAENLASPPAIPPG
jgi:hypothetical protein